MRHPAVSEVREVVRLERLLSGWDREHRLIFCDGDAATNNPVAALRAIGEKRLALLSVLKRGLKTNHACCGRSISSPPFRSGPALRADTAAVAALAIIQATIGDSGRIRATEKDSGFRSCSDVLSTVRSSLCARMDAAGRSRRFRPFLSAAFSAAVRRGPSLPSASPLACRRALPSPPRQWRRRRTKLMEPARWIFGLSARGIRMPTRKAGLARFRRRTAWRAGQRRRVEGKQ